MAPGDRTVVASNRRARHDYEVLDTLECGVVLQGSEVKSLRTGKVQLADSYAEVRDGEVWLHGVHIAPYRHSHGADGHEAVRDRKLLLHGAQVEGLRRRMQREGRLTLVPLRLYFAGSRAKVELALARGRRSYDKRRALAERDARREADRAAAGRRF